MKLYLTYVVAFLLVQLGFAQEQLPDKPTAWVTDYADVLTPVEIAELNEMLAGLEQRSSNQIFVALFDRMPEGYYLEDYAVRLYEKWRPGLPDKDNGILILIFVQDRKIRLEVGYGLEDVVTDAQAGKLISDYMAPEFKQGNYYTGLRSVLDVLIPAVEGKYQLPRVSQKQQENGFPISNIFIILIFLLVFSRIFRGPRSTGYGTRRRTGTGLFLPGLFIGGFGGGRSGGGGFSGGGFSGGFGGMSGGGGASGGW
jgi:uncharacterized protein